MKRKVKESKLELITLIGIFVILVLGVSPTATADELVHKFKNPSFSGIGTSAHYLTIENQEKSRTDKIAEDIKAALLKAEREADNTVLAKFIRNLESRIYAQLSKQLVENMFSNEEGANFGTFTLEGNTITYERREICDADGLCDDWIVMTIVGPVSYTHLTLPTKA